MRYFLIQAVFLIFLFTQCIRPKGQNRTLELPSDSLINEVITSVILIDSLDNSNLGQRKLFFPFIYFMPRWTKDSQIPPPPPPTPPFPLMLQYGCSYEKIFSYFDSSNNPVQRQKDSIFITQQVDTTINHLISDKVSSLFKKKDSDFYWFSLPIFSEDMRTVFISYSEEFYFGYMTVLRKVDNKWVEVEHKPTWIR